MLGEENEIIIRGCKRPSGDSPVSYVSPDYTSRLQMDPGRWGKLSRLRTLIPKQRKRLTKDGRTMPSTSKCFQIDLICCPPPSVQVCLRLDLSPPKPSRSSTRLVQSS